MFRPATRIAAIAPLSRAIPRAHAARRYISTAPPSQKSRSWKSSAARWGLAGALVYYYNTASVFAEEPAYAVHSPPEASEESETDQTVASITEQRRAQARSQPTPLSSQSQSATVATVPDGQPVAAGSPAELEEEASEEGAFNEETGEINWDCPCLGGMAYGPCGEQFRAAFSCFVFSKEEPKGMDCIEHFKTMQNCFREHPEVYGSELEDDEAPPEESEGQPAPTQTDPRPQPTSAVAETTSIPSEKASDVSPQSPTPAQISAEEQRQHVDAVSKQVKEDNPPLSESDHLMPKAWHDASDVKSTN